MNLNSDSMYRYFKMSTIFKSGISFLLIVFLLTSCLDEFQGDRVLVISEEVLEVSAEDVSFLGRLTISTEAPTETGFYLATDEDFANPVVLPADAEPGIGAFVVNFDGLTSDTDYYARAYAIVGGEVFFGETLFFRARLPSLVSFEPQNAAAGKQIRISGLNFTRDTRVFFGEQEAEIVSLVLRSTLTVVVPEIGDSEDVFINISSGGADLSFQDEFTYHTGVWRKMADYPNERQVVGPVVIHDEDELVIGYGNSFVENALNDQFFVLDKTSFEWEAIARPPGTVPVEDPINFEGGYLSGTSFLGLLFLAQPRDSWNYNFGNGAWEFAGVLPFGLSQGLSTNFGGADYVFGGLNGDTSTNRFIWRRDANGNWVQIGTTPFDIFSSQAHFVYNGRFYYQRSGNEIWSYDPGSNEWAPFLTFQDYRGVNNMALVVGDKLYLGLGELGDVLFEIDLISGSIIEKNVFPGVVGEQNVAIWVRNDNLYIIRSAITANARFTGVDRMEVWELDPDALR